MANSLIRGEALAGETSPATSQDARVFMYKGQEARLFNSPSEVPEGEGWRDAPYDLEAEKPRKVKKPAPDAALDESESA